MITIDGQTFDVGIVNIERKATIEKELIGTTIDGANHYNTTGTRYDYDVTFATKKMNIEEYNRLYEVLTAPVDTHSVTMPYGQTTITFNASIVGASDNIIANYNNFRRWSELKISFDSAELQRMVD